jgi:hypothetical protein
VVGRGEFLLAAAGLVLTAAIMDSLWSAIRGSDPSAERLAERRHYYRTVILPSGLVPREAAFWRTVDP